MMKSWLFQQPGHGMSNFIVADRKTDYVLPLSVDDWLNEDHLAPFIVEVIDRLDPVGCGQFS